MTTKITARGQVTVPERMRKALQLSPGDEVQFQLNDNGELVLRKAGPTPDKVRSRRAQLHPRLKEQMRRRAAELLALLRGLD